MRTVRGQKDDSRCERVESYGRVDSPWQKGNSEGAIICRILIVRRVCLMTLLDQFIAKKKVLKVFGQVRGAIS